MLTYFLQVSLCWLVFYGLYYSLLSRETFFRLNRIYLIISLLCGLIAPFGQLFIEVETSNSTVMMLETFVVTASAFQRNLKADTEGWLSLSLVLQVIYGLGVGVMLLRFLIGLFKIFKLYKNGKKVQNEGFITVHTECLHPDFSGGVHLPFSFFNYVFINENVLEKGDIPQIMEHEQAHVSQGHSYDVILLEVLKIIFWWNPIIYFYRHSLRNIHEYLADAAVLRWVEKPVYGRLLIKQSQSGPALALANHFIFSQLKKRILMMTRNRSQRSSLLKYVIAFPLFTVLLTLFAIPNNEIMAKTRDLSEKVNETVETIDNKINQPLQITTVKERTNNNAILNPALSNMDKPFVALGNGEIGGVISAENFKKQTKIICLEGLNGEQSSLIIASFSLVHAPREGDPRQVNNSLSKFNKDALRVIKDAKDGDTYSFMNIKATDGKKFIDMSSVTFFIKDDTKSSGDLYDISPSMKSPEPIRSTIPQERNSGIMVVQKDTSKDDILENVDEVPQFPQGQEGLFKWLAQNIKYPRNAREHGDEGKSYIGFVVEKDGSISNVSVKKSAAITVIDTITQVDPVTYATKTKIVKGLRGEDLDDEAIRVVAIMPRWKPGKNKGQVVRTSYVLPIMFKLQ
jgi:BlaR1 peptidase M56/Gram-negative bacterial TonB protein C-terminal